MKLSSKEEWRVFPEDERYEVSNLGNVRPIATGRLRKPVPIRNGYYTFVVSSAERCKRKAYYFHHAVASTFLGPRPDGMQVSHLDGDKANNALTNLMYETAAENIKRKKAHGTEPRGEGRWSAKLTVSQAREMRRLKMEHNRTYEDIAVTYGVSLETARRAVLGVSGFLPPADDRSFQRAAPMRRNPKGITWRKSQSKWYVQFSVNGKMKHFGSFREKEAAISHAEKIKREVLGL